MQKENLGTYNRNRDYELIMLYFEYLNSLTVLSNSRKKLLPFSSLTNTCKVRGAGGIIRIFGVGLELWTGNYGYRCRYRYRYRYRYHYRYRYRYRYRNRHYF